MEENSARSAWERRRKAAVASLSVAGLVLALFRFPFHPGAVNDHVDLDSLVFGIGFCACGPFSSLVLLYLPFGALVVAFALWPVYFLAIAFTRIGLVHWTRHWTILFIWNLVGLVSGLPAAMTPLVCY